jgi:hypothetical protein
MMNLLAPLAGLLGLEVEGLTQRVKSLAIGYALIALFGLVGLVFLIAAGYIALVDTIGLLPATLAMAGGFLVLALIFYIGLTMGESRRRRHVVEKKRSTETSAFLTTAAFTALPLLARSPMLVKLGLPAAAIAAFALLRDRKPHSD